VRSSRIMRVCSIGAGRGSTRSHSLGRSGRVAERSRSPVGHDANPECIVIGGVRDVVDYMGYVTNLTATMRSRQVVSQTIHYVPCLISRVRMLAEASYLHGL